MPLSEQRELLLQQGNLELSEPVVSGPLRAGSAWRREDGFEGSSHIYSTRLNRTECSYSTRMVKGKTKAKIHFE